MIKQAPSGDWLVEGKHSTIAIVPNSEMQAFITEKVKEHTEHALKILIEHQRHALLPEQRTVCVRCGCHVNGAACCPNCGETRTKEEG